MQCLPRGQQAHTRNSFFLCAFDSGRIEGMLGKRAASFIIVLRQNVDPRKDLLRCRFLSHGRHVDCASLPSTSTDG